jgi:hypothetical protein
MKLVKFYGAARAGHIFIGGELAAVRRNRAADIRSGTRYPNASQPGERLDQPTCARRNRHRLRRQHTVAFYSEMG